MRVLIYSKVAFSIANFNDELLVIDDYSWFWWLAKEGKAFVSTEGGKRRKESFSSSRDAFSTPPRACLNCANFFGGGKSSFSRTKTLWGEITNRGSLLKKLTSMTTYFVRGHLARTPLSMEKICYLSCFLLNVLRLSLLASSSSSRQFASSLVIGRRHSFYGRKSSFVKLKKLATLESQWFFFSL